MRKNDREESLQDGLLLFIPHSLRQKLVEAAHQFLGHTGLSSTYGDPAPECSCLDFVEVARVIQSCYPCLLKDQNAPVQRDVHQPSVQAGLPFQVWCMDVLGPL